MSLNRGYAVTQFYHGMPIADGERYLGGTQDNGTVMGEDEPGRCVAPDFRRRWRLHVAIDPRNHDVIYAETQWAGHRGSRPRMADRRGSKRRARGSIPFARMCSDLKPTTCS